MLKLEIVTPERHLQHAHGAEILLPTTEGLIGVRSGHIPLVVLLKPGEIIIKNNDQEEFLAVAGGFAEVLHDTVYIMADTIVPESELQEEAIQAAITRAKNLQDQASTPEQMAEAAALLEASLARLRVIGIRKRRRK